MHTIVILTETMEIDETLVNRVKQLFPECSIEFRLKTSKKKEVATRFRTDQRKMTKGS